MKTIQIGPWDGDQPTIQVADDATIGQAMQQAGLTLAESQSITTLSDAQDLSRNDLVRDGETYLLTGNQQSGFSFFTINYGN